MMDSESDLDEFSKDERDKLPGADDQNLRFYQFNHPEIIFQSWEKLPVEVKYNATQRMKVEVFWLPLLLERRSLSRTFNWALEVDLIDEKQELTIKYLKKVEVLEAILRAMDRGILDLGNAKTAVWTSEMFSFGLPKIYDHSVSWLQNGDPDIGHRIKIFGRKRTCLKMLEYIFVRYAQYVLAMGADAVTLLKEWEAEPCFYNVPKSETMKERGNRFFEKKQYKEAIKFYTEAINCYPENYLIYGNRALCYLRSQKYLKAVGDGKRAILLEPLWPKGHYRYCEALFSLGEVDMAIYNNTLAMHYCQGDKSSLKDLEQQHLKFHSLLAGFKVEKPITTQKKREPTPEPGSVNDNASKKVAPATNGDSAATNTAPQNKVSQNKMGKKTKKNGKLVPEETSSKPPKPTVSETSAEAQQVKADSLAGPSNATKKKPKFPADSQNEVQQQKSEFTKARLCKELSCTVQDAHTALSDLRSANAEQAFRRALALMGTTTPKDLGLSTQDELLLLYGHASALTDIGQPEELAEAQRVLEKMKSFEERKFQCLVFYGIGRVFVRENRFAVALEPFRDSLQMVKNHIMPGKLTWPFTKEVVNETQPNNLKASLEEAIDLCRFPPPPNAVCRSEKCPGKAEIYFTDPDFKGFIRLCCCQSCVVEYHTTCWKVLKATSFSKKNEKEFLQGPCLTPDCVGKICSIKIFDPTGLAKHKFEEAVPKAERQKKPKVNQKCTSLKKLKSKEERRNRRKQHQQARQQMLVTSSEAQPQKEDSVCQPPQKACFQYRDPVHLQISQNMELLREEKSLQVATLATALRPWLRLDSTKNNQLALKLLSWEKERLETVGQFVEVLLERKNRVWARVFIQVLGDCGDVNPKLYNWACYLNDAGLKAATSFLERYSRELEQLDLTILLQFELLQEMFLEKLGSKPDDLPSIGLSVTEYLKQAPAHDTRLFIWALEEHRDQYDPFHSILDHYFDMMDGHCSIIQKSNENKNNSPLKSRVRKKKQKESKAVFPVQGAMLHGRRGLTSRDEWDQDFSEDESLSFLHSSDPFHVPSHIQRQVAEFELQYNSRGQNKFLDNNPDLTTESLYDYFAQILQEHGPLDPGDPLLVGQLDNFPLVAQTSIRESGSLQTFLLQSLRFVRVGSLIGLANHAVLQQVDAAASLDQLDDIEYPDTKPTFPNPHAAAFTSEPRVFVSAPEDVCPTLLAQSNYYSYPPAPVPHIPHLFSGTAFIESGPSFEWANVDAQQLPAYYLPNEEEEEEDLYSAEAVVDAEEDDPSSSSTTTEEEVLWKYAAVQASQEMRSVAVNTEPHERFEKHQGDVNKMQKNIWSVEEQINKLLSGCEKDQVEDLTELKDEIQKITANIQVTDKELTMFQRKLEEEVKRDHKEKKDNQELLKSLKMEKEQFIKEQQSLDRKLKDTKATYDTVFSDFLELSNQLAAEKRSLQDEIQRYKASLSSATRRALTAQTLHQEMTQGGRRSTEPPVSAANNLPEAPPPSAAGAGPASVREQHTPPDRSLEELADIFPACTRSYLEKCVEEFRSSSRGTLSSSSKDLVGGVTQLILDKQEKEASRARSTPPPPVWQKPEARRTGPKQALNVEDPCIICHEPMGPDDMCVLECRHSFHDHCIKLWLKNNNTCPTCRVHTLLQDDFPALCNKRRQAP